MDKSVIFDTRQLIWSNPDIPHYGTGLVCFRSNYASRTYPAGIDYFNRELTLIFILRGRSEVKINGQDVTLSAGSVLFHGANYLTRHLYSSDDIDFIILKEKMMKRRTVLTPLVAVAATVAAASPADTEHVIPKDTTKVIDIDFISLYKFGCKVTKNRQRFA